MGTLGPTRIIPTLPAGSCPCHWGSSPGQCVPETCPKESQNDPVSAAQGAETPSPRVQRWPRPHGAAGPSQPADRASAVLRSHTSEFAIY